MQITCAAIEKWPGERTPPGRQKRSTFKASFTQTDQLLRSELGTLNAKQVVLQLDVTPDDIRLDGQLRANARPRTSAVVLSFQTKQGAMSFPCDRFDRWKDNIRAIALSLEALRKIDRYGVTRNNEQYTGWTQLPPPTSVYDEVADAVWVADALGIPYEELNSPKALLAAIRKAERIMHPDAGGSAEDFKRLQKMKERISV